MKVHFFLSFSKAVSKTESFPSTKSETFGKADISGTTPMPTNSVPSAKVSRLVHMRAEPPPGKLINNGCPVLPLEGSPMIKPRFNGLNATRKSSAAEPVRGLVSTIIGLS